MNEVDVRSILWKSRISSMVVQKKRENAVIEVQVVFVYPLSLTPIIEKIISVSFVFTVIKN